MFYFIFVFTTQIKFFYIFLKNTTGGDGGPFSVGTNSMLHHNKRTSTDCNSDSLPDLQITRTEDISYDTNKHHTSKRGQQTYLYHSILDVKEWMMRVPWYNALP